MGGHLETLRPFADGNTAAVKSAVYSGRLLGPRAAEIRDALMSLPHVEILDALVCEEIGSVAATLEAIDRELEARPGVAARRHLLEHKARLSKLLVSHLREVGATPRSRFDFGAQLAHRTRVAAQMEHAADD
jgi:hypothetical protein